MRAVWYNQKQLAQDLEVQELQTVLQHAAEVPNSDWKGCLSSHGSLGVYHGSVIDTLAGPASWDMAGPWGQRTRGEMSYFLQPWSKSGRQKQRETVLAWLHSDPNHWSLLLFIKGLAASS